MEFNDRGTHGAYEKKSIPLAEPIFSLQGREVALARGVKELPPAGTVLASCVFSTALSASGLSTSARTVWSP